MPPVALPPRAPRGGAGRGVTLIPEMAVAVETRSARVSVTRFAPPEPARTIGMVWRRSTPLVPQLLQLSEVVRIAALALRGQTLHQI